MPEPSAPLAQPLVDSFHSSTSKALTVTEQFRSANGLTKFAVVGVAILGTLELAKAAANIGKHGNEHPSKHPEKFKAPMYDVEMFPKPPFNSVAPGMIPQYPSSPYGVMPRLFY